MYQFQTKYFLQFTKIYENGAYLSNIRPISEYYKLIN
jgi:hypothetical protein